MTAEKRSIWFDLDNSPHVPLFAPVIKHYLKIGISTIVTARDHAQTVELVRLAGLEDIATVVGRHAGKAKLSKVVGLAARARQLISHVKGLRMPVAVAVSHGSRSMVLAARWLKIPVITMYDYEFTETRIFNRFSDRVIVPQGIPESVLDDIGLDPSKRRRYAGLKEELYVRGFVPAPDFRRSLFERYSIPEDAVLVVLRPPATTANYHSERSDDLFELLLAHLLKGDKKFVVIVPRTREQSGEIAALIRDKFPGAEGWAIPDAAVNGLDLVSTADVIISGGGTMNREGVLLGVPVYSIFAGRQGSLDAAMERDGRITFIRSADDIGKINLIRRAASGPKPALTDRVERFVIGQIDEYPV